MATVEGGAAAGAPQSPAPVVTLGQLFERQQKQIDSLLPKHLNAERLIRIAYNEVRRTPQLLACTGPSLVGALVACAQIGLEPGRHLGHAWLLPFYSSRRQGYDVELVLGYRGLVELGYRSPRVERIVAHAVYDRDEFDYGLGGKPFVHHKPYRGQDRGELVAAYCVPVLAGGHEVPKVMERHELDEVFAWVKQQHAKRSRGKPYQGPWLTHFAEMCAKSPTRRAFKYVPTSVEMGMAMQLDERSEAGEPQELAQGADPARPIEWSDQDWRPISEAAWENAETGQPQGADATSHELGSAASERRGSSGTAERLRGMSRGE